MAIGSRASSRAILAFPLGFHAQLLGCCYKSIFDGLPASGRVNWCNATEIDLLDNG